MAGPVLAADGSCVGCRQVNIQSAFHWGRETRALGKRKPPGILYNLLTWFLRKFEKVWISHDFLANRLNVSTRTIRRWWSENKAAWGLDSRQIGPRRWLYFLVKLSSHPAQTVLAHGSENHELQTSTTEQSQRVEASTAKTVSTDPYKLAQSRAALETIREISKSTGIALVDAIHAARTAAVKLGLNGFQASARLKHAFRNASRRPENRPRSPGWLYTALMTDSKERP